MTEPRTVPRVPSGLAAAAELVERCTDRHRQAEQLCALTGGRIRIAGTPLPPDRTQVGLGHELGA